MRTCLINVLTGLLLCERAGTLSVDRIRDAHTARARWIESGSHVAVDGCQRVRSYLSQQRAAADLSKSHR